MKRLTQFNDVKQALATSSEHYRKFILTAISRAMKAPDLRLSRVLQRLMPNTELESLINKLTSNKHLTNTVRRTIKYDLMVNARTLFKLKDVFNLTDSTSKATLLSIMEQLNYIDYRKKKAEMIPVRHLIPSTKRLIDTTPTSTAQKNYNKGAK
jgi:hypothetical protein